MECLSAVIKVLGENEKLEGQWSKHRFDRAGKPVSFPWPADRTLAVNSRTRATCSLERKVPHGSMECLQLKIEYQVQCQFNGAERAAQKLFHRVDSPQRVLENKITADLNAWFHSTGKDAVLRRLFSAQLNAMEAVVRASISQSGLEVDEVKVSLTSNPQTKTAIRYDKKPIDLANNCKGVPVTLSADIDLVPGDEYARALAHWQEGQEMKMEASIHEKIGEFFLGISLHRYFSEREAVQAELQKALDGVVKLRGRKVSRLVVAPSELPQKIIPLAESFECLAGDGTQVRISLEGGLHIDDYGKYMDPADWNRQQDAWPRLLTALRDSASATLGRMPYTEIHGKLQKVYEEILAPVKREASDKGVDLVLRLRFSWPYSSLLQVSSIHRIVHCQVGSALADCEIRTDLDILLVDSMPIGRYGLPLEQLRGNFETEIDRCVKSALSGCSLSEYFAFDAALRAKIVKEIESGLRTRFGLEVKKIQLERHDDAVAKNILQIIKEAPMFRVAHPNKPDMTFTGQFRVSDYVASVNPSFVPFPTSIEDLKTLVAGYTRQILNEIPTALVYGQAYKLVLREVVGGKLHDIMLEKHGLKVDLMYWVPDQPNLFAPLHGDLAELMERFRALQRDPYAQEADREELRRQMAGVASEMQLQGEAVPWENLRTMKVECPEAPKLQPPEEMIKGLIGGSPED